MATFLHMRAVKVILGLQSVTAILFAMAIALSCATNENIIPNPDYQYFPLQGGKFWIYDVEETSITQTTCGDAGQTISKYEMRLSVVDSVLNSDNGYTYTIQRAKRTNNTQPWSSLVTMTSQISGSRAINNEGNINFVKLLFPISVGLSWDGNLFNKEQELNGQITDLYKITSADKPYTNSSEQSFERAVIVTQNDEQTNILYRDTRTEVYAFKVGLVYKESFLLKYFSNSQLPCYGQNKIQQGYILKQSLKEYGKN